MIYEYFIFFLISISVHFPGRRMSIPGSGREDRPRALLRPAAQVAPLRQRDPGEGLHRHRRPGEKESLILSNSQTSSTWTYFWWFVFVLFVLVVTFVERDPFPTTSKCKMSDSFSKTIGSISHFKWPSNKSMQRGLVTRSPTYHSTKSNKTSVRCSCGGKTS